MKKNIVVWGDSLARGVIYDDEKKRYRISPVCAANIISEKTGAVITNRSHMGMTSAQGLSQMQDDIARGIGGDVAFLEFGGNDSDFDWKAISEAPDAEHLPKTVISQYEEDMCRMIELSREHGMEPMLATLPPLMADRYFEFFSRNGLNRGNILHWLGDVNKIYRFHERYSLAVARIASKYNCRIMDLRTAFLDKWDARPYFCADGIHPNDAGQRLIGETILKALSPA